MSAQQTESEVWFDRYVRDHGHDPGEHEPDLGIQRNPDRLLTWNGHQVVCEIKEFAQDVIPAGAGVGAIAPERWYGAVRSQVHAAARQMRELAESGLPLVAVLANPQGMFVPLGVDEVISALYGNPQIQMRIDRATGAAIDEGRFVAGPDGEIRNDHRYLSAVVLLRHGDHRRDWIDRLAAELRQQHGGDAKTYEEAGERWEELEVRAREAEALGHIPGGEYFRTDVILTASADATRLAEEVFDGPRDTRWELKPETGAFECVRRAAP